MIYMTLESGPHSDADAEVTELLMPGLNVQIDTLAAMCAETWYGASEYDPATVSATEDILFALIGALAERLSDNYTVAILDTRPEWALKTGPVQASFEAVKLAEREE